MKHKRIMAHVRRRFRQANLISITAVAFSGIVFVIITFLLLQTTDKNIKFIEKEMLGLHHHQDLLQLHVHMHEEPDNEDLLAAYQELTTMLTGMYEVDTRLPQLGHSEVYTLLATIADQSNLTLDADLGSYYLMHIIVRIAPDMLVLVLESPNGSRYTIQSVQNLTRQLHRSINIIDKAGLGADGLKTASKSLVQLLTDMAERNRNFSSEKAIKAIVNIYEIAAIQLERALENRLSNEKLQYRKIATIVLMLFLMFAFLLVVSLRHATKVREFKAAKEKLVMLHELKQANKELETFSYFTAHDLKEPMRTISSFATILEKDDTSNLSAEHRQYLEVMKSSAIRMNKLINDLIDYLNKGDREGVELAFIDTQEQLELVLADLQVQIEDSNAILTYDPMPRITTHGPSFRRVMQNLISNAIKYRKPGVAPAIHIQTYMQGKDWVFEVQDNGIGFDMVHAKTILEPFKRLHAHEDIEGSGMGLSICKKLLERLGGRIWVQSKPGKGTTVYISIPDSK